MVATKDLKSFGLKSPCRFESGPEYNVTIRKNDGTDAKYEMETFETRTKELIRHKPYSRYIYWFHSSAG